MRKSLTLIDSYKDYKANTKQAVSYGAYRKVCEAFNKAVSNKILEEAYEFVLPYRLGTLRIKKRKLNLSYLNGLRVDYKKSKEAGKTVYHLNEHTNGIFYSWWWNKRTSIVKNKTYYKFIPTRVNKRAIKALIDNPNKIIDYFE